MLNFFVWVLMFRILLVKCKLVIFLFLSVLGFIFLRLILFFVIKDFVRDILLVIKIGSFLSFWINVFKFFIDICFIFLGKFLV